MVGPLFEDTEALYPLYRLREAGAQVAVIGAKAGDTVPGKKGHELEVEQAAGDVSAHELDLLVIAGGYGPDKLRTDDGVLRPVRDMHEGGSRSHSSATPAGCRRPLGIVEGRRVTPSPPSRTTCATPAPSGRTPRSWWTAT